MSSVTTVAVLPVGEFDSEPVRSAFDAIVGSIRRLGGDILLGDPVSDEEQARRSVEQLAQKDPDLLFIVPLRGRSAPVIETAVRSSPTPCLVWPVQGWFALPSSTLAIGALREAGFPVEFVYAPPETPEIVEDIRSILKAAKAFVRIKRSRIGIIGGLFPNLVSCRYDPQIVSTRLGVTLVPISFEDIRGSIRLIADHGDALQQSRLEITSSYPVNPTHIPALDAGIKLHLVMKQIAREQQIDGYAAECWSAFPAQLGLNPCLGFIEDAYTLACEGDVMLCIALLMVRYMTGSSAYVGDLYDLDLDGIMTLIHCGAPASLAVRGGKVDIVKSQLASERGFETMTCRPHLENGQVTVFRFYGRDCDKMHVTNGELFDSDPANNLTVRLRIAGSRWNFLKECFGNHYIVAAGDIRKELAQLCKWFGITIIYT